MLIRKSKGSFSISIKMISIFLCICFMSHELSLYAEPATLTQIKQEIKEEAFFVIPHIPQTLGALQESYNAGAKAPTIIFIQDAHDSLEAQENIALLVNYFVDQYHAKTVFEEGYEGTVPTDEYFDFIKDPLKKQRASYFLMDKLRLGGAEYAHINREQDFNLIGIDDRKLHARNLEAYKSSALISGEIASQIQVIEKEIKKLANQKLPNEFKEWMRIREKFDRSEMDIAQYLKRIRQLFLKNKSEDSFKTSYPHITMILSWDHQGAGHSFESKINYKNIFEELHQLEKDYADAYLNRQNHKKIFTYYNDLQLLKKLSVIEMSSEEYAVIKASLKELKTEKMADFIFSETGQSIVFSNAWETQIQHAIQFYEIALQRDAAFESHLKQRLMNLKEEKAAVLVFGGFHKDHIREILKKNKISYHIISPNITQASPKHRAYYKQLMGIGYHDFENSLMASKAAKTNPVFSLPFGRAQLSAISQSLDRIDMESDLWLSELEMAMTSLASRSELRSPSYQIDLKQSEYVLSLIKPLYEKPLLPNAPEFSETLLSGGITAGAANKFGVLDMLLNAISDDPSFHDEVIKIFEEAPRKIATEIELAIEVLQWIRKTEFSATNLPEGLNQRIAMHIKDGGGSSGIVDELRKYTGYLPPQGSSSDQFSDDRSAQREKMQLERKRIVEEHPEWLEQLEETLRVLKPKLIDALTALLRIDESKQQTEISEAENRASKEIRSELRSPKQVFWSETPRLSDAETTQRLDRLMLQYAHIRQQQEQPISTFSEYGAFLPSEAELLQDFVEKQNLDPYRLNRQLKKLIPLTTLVSFLASYFIAGTFFSAVVMPVMIATVITAIVFAILYYFSLQAIAQEQGRVGGLKILDVGMGDGFAGRVLKAYTHAHVTAIELDPERFQYSLDVEQYIRNSSDVESQNLTMLEGDFLTHPIENYDAIYQYFAAPHVNNSKESERKMLEFSEAILEKLDRELKSGAVFVSPLFGGHKKTKSPEMKKLLAKFPNLKFSYYSTQVNDTDHPTLVIRRRSELRSSDMAVDEKVSQYMQLERFLNNNRISSGQNRDGTLYVPTPLSILPAIHRELTRFVGPLKDKRYLSFGAGGLVDSLAASSLAGMKVTAIEKDLILEKHAQTILTQAINHGIEGAKNIQLSAGDAFEVSWKDEDVVFFFYTQSGGSVEIRNQYRTTFEKQLEIKIAEMKPGSTIALLFTGTQLMAEQDDYEVLKALENQRLQISDEMTGLYLDLYRIPERSELRFSQDSIDVEYLKEVTGFFLGDESFIHPEGLTYAIRDFFVRDKMASTTRLVKELVGENYSAEDVKHLHLRNFQFGQYFLIFKGTLTLSNGKEASFTFVAPSPVDVGNNQRINREFELLSKYHALRPDNVVRPYFKGEGSVGEQTDERSIKHLSFYTSQFLPDFIEMNPQYLSIYQLHFFMNSGGRESEAIASLQLNQEDRDTHESVMSEIVKNIVELTVYDEKTGRFTFPTELQLLRGDMMLRPNGKGKDSSFDLKLIAIRAEKENASIVEYFAYLLNPHFGAATNSSKAISPRSVFRGMAQGLVHTYGLEKGNQYFEDWLRTFVEEVDLSSNYGRDLFEMIDQFYEQKLSAQALAAETNQVDIVDNVGDVSAGLNTTSLRKALDGIFGSSNSHEQIRIVNGKEIRILYAEKYIQIEEFVFLDPEDWEKHAEQLEPVKDHIILTHLKKGMLSGRAAFIHHGHSDNAISLMLSKREIFKDEIVLDAGSGDGVLSRLASKLGAKEVISVENGKHAIAAAQQIALLSPDSKIQLYEQDILKVKESLSEKSIGVVIANLNPDDFWKDENYDDWHIRLMNDFKPEWYFYMGLKDDGSGLIQAVVEYILKLEWDKVGLIDTPSSKSYGLKGFVFKRKQRSELRLAENPIEEKIRSSEAAAILLIDGGMLATRHELRVEAFAMAYQTKALTHLRLIIYDAEKLGVEAYEQFSTLANVRLVRGNVRMALNQYGRSKSLKRVHLIQDSLVEQLANVDSFLWNDAVDIWAALIYALSDEYVFGISKIKGIYRMIGDTLKAKLQEYRSHLIVRISA